MNGHPPTQPLTTNLILELAQAVFWTKAHVTRPTSNLSKRVLRLYAI